MDQIGWIRRLRRRKHKSEREIACITGLSRNTVAQRLHGGSHREFVHPRSRAASAHSCRSASGVERQLMAGCG
ncbi:MAG: helix-turn-helix transcriptional regulator [Rubrivivax sp.]|nr:helix-turn-helix transcriptional regulator [Rubrivivax sp.]